MLRLNCHCNIPHSQASSKGNASVGVPWVRRPAPQHGRHHPGLCLPGLPLPRQQGRPHDLRSRPFCLPWHPCRICVRSDLQELWWREVEVQRPPDQHALSRHRLCPLLHPQPGALVLRLLCRHPLLHARGAVGTLVRGVGAAHLRRGVLWLQESSD